MERRIDKINYYLDIAETVLTRSTCIRRAFGAVIVKNDEIVSTGYNGAPRGRENCNDTNKCIRLAMDIPRGQRYELCCSVHAEANAIISASRADMIDSSLFLVGIERNTKNYVQNAECCAMCKRLVINAGIKEVYCRLNTEEYIRFDVKNDWIDNWDKEFDIKGY